MSLEIIRLNGLSSGVQSLSEAARAEGFTMLERLISNFRSGNNTFSRPGEILFGVEQLGVLIGIGGLNIDPYFKESRVGRIRHLYVHPSTRKIGVGRMITKAIEVHAVGRFDKLQLFTPTRAASEFYEALGYVGVSGVEKVSHVKVLDS